MTSDLVVVEGVTEAGLGAGGGALRAVCGLTTGLDVVTTGAARDVSRSCCWLIFGSGLLSAG